MRRSTCAAPWLVAAVIALSMAPAASAGGARRLIALEDVEQSSGVDELFVIDDPATGVASLVGSLGNGFVRTEAIAVGWASGAPGGPAPTRIFVADDDRLLELDPDTGDGTVIGPIGFPDVDGLGFDPATGILYGVTYRTNELISIDTGTGAGTLVADDVIPGKKLNAIAFHPFDGRAFVLTETHDEWSVRHIDLDTGDEIEEWELSGASSMESLIWSPDGNTLYSAADRGDTKDLVTIELLDDGTETGIATFVSGEASGCEDIEGLAWVSRDGGVWRFAPPGTGIDVATSPDVPRIRLDPPSPNPSRSQVTLRFAARSEGRVTLDVYDVQGRWVRSLANLPADDGLIHSATWRTDSVPGGVYFVTLRNGAETMTRKLIITK